MALNVINSTTKNDQKLATSDLLQKTDSLSIRPPNTHIATLHPKYMAPTIFKAFTLFLIAVNSFGSNAPPQFRKLRQSSGHPLHPGSDPGSFRFPPPPPNGNNNNAFCSNSLSALRGGSILPLTGSLLTTLTPTLTFNALLAFISLGVLAVRRKPEEAQVPTQPDAAELLLTSPEAVAVASASAVDGE